MEIPKSRKGEKGIQKKKMEKNPNLHKVSLVLNATGMDTLRKNVRIIGNRKARSMPQQLVTRTLQILIMMRAVTEKEITLHFLILLISSLRRT